MGFYLNPGKQRFEIALNSEIFVDKTEMIQYLNTLVNTNQRFVSVSRPRRFGKTMAADMICAYYDRTADSRVLFMDKRLADSQPFMNRRGESILWDTYLGRFNVLRIVMTDFLEGCDTVRDVLNFLTDEVMSDLKRAFPDILEGRQVLLRSALGRIYAETGIPFVIVIDEWDAIFRMRKDDKDGQIEFLNFLRDLVKDREYAALVYMTGILPIKKYGEHSALNMFDEYSMTEPKQLARFAGFTDEEVRNLCMEYGRDYDRIKDWYDGYLVSDAVRPDPNYKWKEATGAYLKAHKYSLYSPLSVVNAVRNGLILNYWNNTESYEALAEYIRRDFDGLKGTVALLMDGARVPADLTTYQNDMTTFHSRDDVLALLIHLGYLGYDSDQGEVFIPNREVRDVFRSSTKSADWSSTFSQFETSKELLRATWSMDEEAVARLVEKAHDQASNQTYHDEAALSYGIQLAYYAAEKYYTKALELDSGKGYVDIVYIPSPEYSDKPVLLIELKYEKNTDTALEQIRRQNYPDRLRHYKGNILLVAINYDKEVPYNKTGFKHHRCKIERA